MIKVELDRSIAGGLRRRLVNALRQVCRDFNSNDEIISVTILDSQKMRALNKRYLRHDCPTDVISFSYNEYPHTTCEIFACADVAREQARRRKIPRSEELSRYIIHGLLHHLGLNDKTPNERNNMFKIQERYVAELAAAGGTDRTRLTKYSFQT